MHMCLVLNSTYWLLTITNSLVDFAFFAQIQWIHIFFPYNVIFLTTPQFLPPLPQSGHSPGVFLLDVWLTMADQVGQALLLQQLINQHS